MDFPWRWLIAFYRQYGFSLEDLVSLPQGQIEFARGQHKCFHHIDSLDNVSAEQILSDIQSNYKLGVLTREDYYAVTSQTDETVARIVLVVWSPERRREAEDLLQQGYRVAASEPSATGEPNTYVLLMIKEDPA